MTVLMDDLEAGEMRIQYRLFLRRLEELLEVKMQLTSMEILKRMLRTEDKRYQDCEVIMDVLTRAACLKSVEGSFPEKVFWTHPPQN